MNMANSMKTAAAYQEGSGGLISDFAHLCLSPSADA